MRLMKRPLFIHLFGSRLTLLAATLCAGTAQAATNIASTVSASATVLASCQTPSTNALAFGTYSPSEDKPGTTTLSVRCTGGTPIVVSLNKGTTTGASIAQRKLANGTNTLNYNLYSNSPGPGGTNGSVWGDTALVNTVSSTGLGLGTDRTFTVYGLIPAGQNNAVPGNYSDLITVTVTY
jgi:spore coat protein U-like protein